MSGVADPRALLGSVHHFLQRQGARVWLDPKGENLICAAKAEAAHSWEVKVQGWPNLVHELAHILQAGRLDEDSGFEYALVPLDLSTQRGRGYLWDELSACALSCAWGAPYRSTQWSRAWFFEQVEILPVFFGDEGNPQRFARRVDQCISAHGEELSWAQARLWAMAHNLDCCDGSDSPAWPALCFPGPSTARELLALRPKWLPGMQEVQGPFSVRQLWGDLLAHTPSWCTSS